MKTEPNYRTVTLKLPRWMVCRLLVMLSAMISGGYLRPGWNEKTRALIREQLDKHDQKVRKEND